MPTNIPLVQVFTRPCDGECGGDVTVLLAVETFAATTDCYGDTRYTTAESDAACFNSDGSLSVSCHAVDSHTERTCDGNATILPHDIAKEEWVPRPTWATMHEVDR